MIDISLRAATEADLPFLWRMLTHAASMQGPDRATLIARAKRDDALVGYLQAWGREGDDGLIAYHLEETGALEDLGACWHRLPDPAHPDSPMHVSLPAQPELSIALCPHARGAGIGATLLDALAQRAHANGYRALRLSVRQENPASQLYLRCGFVVVDRIVNRVGGESWVMAREL